MDKEAVIIELEAMIGDYLKNQGLDLVELIYRRQGRGIALGVLVDRPEGGISMGECARLNSQIGAILDEKAILQQGYILEVSSPGLDRPLKVKNDFLRCMNRRVKFFLNEPVAGRIELDGTISAIDDTAVHVDIEGKRVAIALSKINKAKQIISCI